MYSVDATNAHLLIGYRDVFLGDMPNLKSEIEALNMHKAISIICELIRVRDAMLKPIQISVGEFIIPFESVLKKEICGINPESPEEMFTNPLLRKDVHIVSIQMLLLLLKQVIQYGNYETLNHTEYEITLSDYRKIIQLQLVVVEEINQKHLKEELDVNHFLYSTYHLNYRKNVSHEFLRMYYMMEKISRSKYNFDDSVQNEYVDYYTDFTAKYGFTPTQYLFLLFGELTTYYSDINGLIYASMWKDVKKAYASITEKGLIIKVINTLSQPIEKYFDWVRETEIKNGILANFLNFLFC